MEISGGKIGFLLDSPCAAAIYIIDTNPPDISLCSLKKGVTFMSIQNDQPTYISSEKGYPQSSPLAASQTWDIGALAFEAVETDRFP